MVVHPEIRAFLDALAELNLPPVQNLSPEAARAQMEAGVKARNIPPTEVGAVAERSLPGPGGAIRSRIYTPAGGRRPHPLLVYFHGGGHVIGSLDTHDAIARNLCAGAQCVVASIDYRMGPEHKFPAAFDDGVAATAWLAANAAEIGADPSRLAVGGDSAGGNLAAAVAIAARDAGGPALCHQLLVYPLVDYRCDSQSYETFATGYGVLEAETMQWFREHYLRSAADADDWRASPLLADSLADLPPALVFTAECDVLHDEGVAYARALAAAGNAVEHIEASGMIHGFFGLAPMINGAVVAQAQAVEALRRGFGL